MCGIAGYVGNGTRKELDAMLKALEHRGPDDSGIHIREDVGFGHRRLSIIDTSMRGHQPMLSADKRVVIILNGEIYNYRELQRSIKNAGRQLMSDSDTEVLLHLYAMHGEDMLRDVVGMFAFALYDEKNKKLILARDRMGEKPLYWKQDKGCLRFASELKGLLASGIEKRLNVEALQQYLLFDFVPTPLCIIEGVNKLEAGTMLILERGTVFMRPFWQPKGESDISEDDAVKRLDVLLQKSVSRQLVADVPLGVFLSGGLDSSTVAYYAKHAVHSIDTFSIGFDDPSFDESEYAREVAKFLGTRHHDRIVSSADALELVSSIADVFSEPVADASVIPTMLLSKFARRSVTVALGGDGSDELFAGYVTFQADTFSKIYRMMPDVVKDIVVSVLGRIPASHKNFPLSYNLKKFVGSTSENSVHRHLEWLGTFGKDARRKVSGPLLLPLVEDSNEFAIPDSHADNFDGSEHNKLLFTYMRMYLMDQVLVKVDRASMHYALETRAPFLDHTLVDFVLSLPYSLKYHRGTTKYILKQLMRDKLPPSIVNRKKKGFGIPLARWLAGPLRPLCEELLSKQSLKEHGLFDERYVGVLKDMHMQGKRDNRKELWNLMVFQMWYQRYM
ncbi:MAG: asparagine synthase [Parcubacteria group bacterium Gr01-1014_8]|nr:MAG: asparagine synthase [Parcubacteria group bacterium Gr01-1014_8]